MTRPPLTRRRLRITLTTYAVVGAIALLDRYCGLAAAPHNDAWIGIALAIIGIIWDGVQVAADYFAIALQFVVHVLWGMVVGLMHVVADGFWIAARALGHALDYIKIAWDRALKPFLQWAYKKLSAVEFWIKEKLAPVLRFLEAVKASIDQVYRSFVKPIIDTIEFLRALNRVLETFHIDLLQKLDEVLQNIEQRLEDPFLWVRQKITWVEGWIDRIVTFDGLFQRLTLVGSMARYAGPWVNGFWNSQLHGELLSGTPYSRGRAYPLDEWGANGSELAAFYRGEGSRMDGDIHECVLTWRLASERPTGIEVGG